MVLWLLSIWNTGTEGSLLLVGNVQDGIRYNTPCFKVVSPRHPQWRLYYPLLSWVVWHCKLAWPNGGRCADLPLWRETMEELQHILRELSMMNITEVSIRNCLPSILKIWWHSLPPIIGRGHSCASWPTNGVASLYHGLSGLPQIWGKQKRSEKEVSERQEWRKGTHNRRKQRKGLCMLPVARCSKR